MPERDYTPIERQGSTPSAEKSAPSNPTNPTLDLGALARRVSQTSRGNGWMFVYIDVMNLESLCLVRPVTVEPCAGKSSIGDRL